MSIVEENYKYSELTKAIIGLAMKVHRKLGPGFPEIIYKRALIIELKGAGLSFVVEYRTAWRYLKLKWAY